MISLFRSSEIGAGETSQESVKINKEIDFSWGIRIPMRDGIELNGTLYKP